MITYHRYFPTTDKMISVKTNVIIVLLLTILVSGFIDNTLYFDIKIP